MEIEQLAKLPFPGMDIPVRIAFKNDTISFLQTDEKCASLTRQLYGIRKDGTEQERVLVHAAGNTENNLSLEEKLRRERQRQLGVGITSYTWNPVRNELLVPLMGNLYLKRDDEPLELVFDKVESGLNCGAIDAQYSSNGKFIAFVLRGDIYKISTETSKGSLPELVRCTKREDGAKYTNGLACFLTQEELDRYRGFWWSHDSQRIAFEQVDESNIPEFRIMHSGKDSHGEDAEENHRYPFAGGPNPTRKVGVIDVTKNEIAEPIWMSCDDYDSNEYYFARMHWLQNGHMIVQRLNRLQTETDLLLFNTSTGKSKIILHQVSDVWINVHNLFKMVTILPDGTLQFIWGSEKSGFQHLYMYNYKQDAREAECMYALTEGDWIVESICGLLLSDNDDHDGVLFISGTYTSCLERHLYAIPLERRDITLPINKPLQLTKALGMHNISMDAKCTTFVDVYSSTQSSPKAEIFQIPTISEINNAFGKENAELKTTSIRVLHTTRDKRVEELGSALRPPEIISFPSFDQKVTLYGALYKPDHAVHGNGPFPTMVHVYGGPHVQRVSESYTMCIDMRAQKLRSLGIAVLRVDNRGSFRRGLKFEGAIKHQMGTIEIEDQKCGVQKLIQDGITIPGRVGIYGWSYGGYMSIMCLLKASDVFKVGISGAPVTSWDGYDTCYTERYMSTPQLNQEGYQVGNAMEYVAQLQDSQKLLLVHGLIDENVHFRHTARFINALIHARKRYDVMLFPNERHSPRSVQDRIYMEERIIEYVMVHL